MAVKKGKTGSGDAFAKAASKARKRWDESKKKKDGFTGGLPYGEVEDGDYEASFVKGVAGVTKKGEGDIYISLDFVLRGDHEGTEFNIFHDLSTTQKSDAMARTLKRLDYDIDELDPADLPDIIADLNKTLPDVMVQVRNVTEDKDGKAYDEPRCYVNVQKTIKLSDKPAKKSKKKK